MPERVKAPGFPTAPLVETVFAASFADGLKPEERDAMAELASAAYPRKRVEKQHAIRINQEEVSVGEIETFYRLEGTDDTELLLLRPEGLATCQLAPYRSWDLLFERFRRDLQLLWENYPDKRVTRLAVRSINRIDVPLVGSEAPYEDYLALHIHVPDEVKSIGPFRLELMLDVPEAKATATVRSGITEPPVDGVMSFLLDIDLARTKDLPEDHGALFNVFSALHEPKNRLYRTFLTPKALEEFK